MRALMPDRNVEVVLTRPDQDGCEYRVDADRGEIMFDSSSIPTGFQNIMVDYTGGYERVPDDVEQVANEMVQMLFNMGKRDPMLQSENLGDYSYSLAANMDLSKNQLAVLAPYKRVR